MLTRSIVEEIAKLLSEGRLSQRKIAARLGVSRGTVGAIASGRRGIYGKEPFEDDSEPMICASPPQRCRHCGYLVSVPCLVCRTRQYRERQRRLAARDREPGAGRKEQAA
jgi:hypothetical protein